MKTAVFGAALGAGLTAAVIGGIASVPTVYATPGSASVNAELISVPLTTVDHRQQMLLIDPRQRVMGVYQIDANTGEIALKSVRNFNWDMQLSEFNSASPLPREIRSLVDQR
jgi:hypothetical protein